MLRALPYFYNSVVDADKTARVLQWSEEYHAALGFSASLLYVLPRDVAAFVAHPGIRALVEEQRLVLVLWDQHAGFAEFMVSREPLAWHANRLQRPACKPSYWLCMQFCRRPSRHLVCCAWLPCFAEVERF